VLTDSRKNRKGLIVRKQNPILAGLLALLLITLCCGQSFAAGKHVVSTGELRSAVQSVTVNRQTNLETVDSFLRSPAVAKALKGQHLPLEQVRKAVPFLSNAELSQLAEQSRQIEQDIQAGALDNQQITYILIALITAVVVLILVAD